MDEQARNIPTRPWSPRSCITCARPAGPLSTGLTPSSGSNFSGISGRPIFEGKTQSVGGSATSYTQTRGSQTRLRFSMRERWTTIRCVVFETGKGTGWKPATQWESAGETPATQDETMNRCHSLFGTICFCCSLRLRSGQACVAGSRSQGMRSCSSGKESQK